MESYPTRQPHGMPSGLGLLHRARLPSLTGFLSLTIIPRSPGIVGAKHFDYINLRRAWGAKEQAAGKDAVLGLRKIRGASANHQPVTRFLSATDRGRTFLPQTAITN